MTRDIHLHTIKEFLLAVKLLARILLHKICYYVVVSLGVIQKISIHTTTMNARATPNGSEHLIKVAFLIQPQPHSARFINKFLKLKDREISELILHHHPYVLRFLSSPIGKLFFTHIALGRWRWRRRWHALSK